MAERTGPPGPAAGSGAAPALLLALPLLAGCGLFSPEPELLKRWDRYTVADTTGLMRVTVFTARSPASDAPSALADLSRSAQATFVRAMADRTTTVAGLQDALASPLASPGASDGEVDRTVFRRRLVISVERTGPVGAREEEGLSRKARVARSRIALGLRGDRARFTSWDRFVTRWDTVELGTMSRTRSVDLGGDVELLPGTPIDEAGEVGLSASLGSQLDESLTLSERHVSNGILRPDSMILLQEGSAGIDLVGNSGVELELRLARGAATTSHLHRFEGLFDSAGRPSPPGTVRIERRRHVYPSRSTVDAGGIAATLRHEIVIRAVRRDRGDATYAEGDDRVVFLRDTGRGGSAVVLVPAREMRASAWRLVRTAGGTREVLQVAAPPGSGPGATSRELRFATADDARALLRWLDAHRRSPLPGPEPPSWASAGADAAADPEVTMVGRTLYLAPRRPLRRSQITELAIRLHPLNWTP